MKSAPISLPFLLSFAFALALVPAAAGQVDDEPAAVPAAESRPLKRARARSEWGPRAVSRIYGMAYAEEDEPDGTTLRGVSLLYSSWDETVNFSGGLGWYLSWQEGGQQTIWGGGFELTWLPWAPEAPVRFGPRLRLGLEDRRIAPDEGLGGMAAAGLELGFWMGDSFQLALIADREFPFRAEARTQLGVSLRFARRRY